MKTIPLTQGFVALVDDEDFPRLAGLGWYARRDRSGTYTAAHHPSAAGRAVRPAVVFMHRLIMDATDGVEVDHRRHREAEKIIDNRRSNLRLVTRPGNQRNRRKLKRGHSIFKGVTIAALGLPWQRWVSSIRVGGTAIYLGRFKVEGYAALAYDLAAVKHFGEHALTNFPVPGSTNWLYGEVPTAGPPPPADRWRP